MNNETLYDDDTKSGNEGGFTPLPPLDVGTHNYEITDGRLVNFPADTKLGVDFTFKHLGTGRMHGNLYAVFGSHEIARRIAREKLKALGDACGLAGKMTLDRLQNFFGKKVEITVTEHKVVGDKTYAQISTTYPANGPAGSTAPATAPAAQTLDKDDQIPMTHPTDAATPPVAPATDAAAPKAGSFAERRRQRLAGAAS